ncbi:uncharacterized protein LOC134802106 [Cydia splendana]|uniref:uncharacterized protein LOC134802106 n=1 Tax=Cydia splendana TaxID=1100963 RepID=UPI00300CD69A
MRRKDYYEIDPDEFYVPFLNREATNLEDVYVIKEIFSEDEYFQIYSELAEIIYLDDLHPYIQQSVDNKTLSIEFTVLAVYASVLLKFLHASLEEIRTGNSEICQHSKTLYEILLKRFTERVQYEKRTSITRSRVMRNKIVCHIIVCTLILNDFQFKMDSLSDVIERKNHEPLPTLVSFVAATIEKGDDGPMVKLKLPLVVKLKNLTALEENYCDEFHILPVNRGVTKVRGVCHKKKISSRYKLKLPLDPKARARLKKPSVTKIKKDFVQRKDYYEIDPDEFYIPFLNREATKVEDVYVINQIFSDDEYSQIFFELAENNYLDDLHPYIKQFVENKTLSLEFTVLAVYASVLIKFLHASLDEIKKGNSKICQHSKTLYAIILKRFTEQVKYKTRSGLSRSRAMRNKIVCHIIVCTLILNDFQFEMDSLSDAIKGNYNKNYQEPLRKLVSYVAATIEIGDDETMVKLKLPLVPKIRASIPRKFAQKIILSKDEYVQSVQTSIINEDSEMAVQLKLPLVPKPQAPLRKPKLHKIDKKCEDHYEINEDELYCEIDPDEFYVPFLNREATNLEDVYVINQIFSEDEYSQIFLELGETNYMGDLHPYIHQFVENKTLSLEFTVLAVYASVLIKFLHASLDKIKKGNSKICQHSKTLYEILLNRFTQRVQYEKRTNITRSRAMRSKIVCHIIVCTLILNDFQFKMDSLSDVIERKPEPLPTLVRIVAATIEIRDDGTMVKLKLPIVPKTQATILRKYAQKIKRNLTKRKEETETDEIDPDDFYLPAVEDHTDKILSKDEYVQSVQTSIISEDSEMTMQLKLPLVTKPQAPLRKPMPHKIDKKFVQRESHYEIDPDEFYVQFLNREATNLEDVYVIDQIFSEDEYSQIFFELAENNYLDDLHPYIKQFVENKTLSLEFTVLAVYASVLIKFLHASLDKIKTVPKTRATILRKDAQKIERNLKKRKGGGGEEAETDKIDPDDFYLPTIDREATEVEDVYPVEEILPKDEYETIDEDEGSLVKLKLPLVPKTEDIINKTSKRHTVDKDLTEYNENMVDTDDIIDPDDFYVLPINRDATELENVYLIDKIFSKSKYEKIYCELEKSDYSEYLHPYIQSIVENQSLSLQLTVLAVYANGDNGKMVQLKLPLVSKTRITRRKRSTKIRKIKTATSSKRRKKR